MFLYLVVNSCPDVDCFSRNVAAPDGIDDIYVNYEDLNVVAIILMIRMRMVIDDGDRDDLDADHGDNDDDSDDCCEVVVDIDDVKPVKTDSAGDRPSCETSHPKLVLDLAVERLLQFDEDEVEKDDDDAKSGLIRQFLESEEDH